MKCNTCKRGISLDHDRQVTLRRNEIDGSLQLSFSKSGISTNRCGVRHTYCKCGKGRTMVSLCLTDEAIQAAFVLYRELHEEEQKMIEETDWDDQRRRTGKDDYMDGVDVHRVLHHDRNSDNHRDLLCYSVGIRTRNN